MVSKSDRVNAEYDGLDLFQDDYAMYKPPLKPRQGIVEMLKCFGDLQLALINIYELNSQ